MKYTWDNFPSERFPDFRDGFTEIGYGSLFDANGQQLGPYIVSFDSETGEIWEQVRDDEEKPVYDHEKGEVVVKHSVHPAPLRWESSRKPNEDDPQPYLVSEA